MNSAVLQHDTWFSPVLDELHRAFREGKDVLFRGFRQQDALRLLCMAINARGWQLIIPRPGEPIQIREHNHVFLIHRPRQLDMVLHGSAIRQTHAGYGGFAISPGSEYPERMYLHRLRHRSLHILANPILAIRDVTPFSLS